MEEILEQDERMKELQAKEVELLSAQEKLSARLRDVSEAEMRRQWVEIQSQSEEAFFQTQKAQEEALARTRWIERDDRTDQARDQYVYTYRSPTIVGQSFFLGAQMAPLNPELAAYFPVEEGVIVLEVVEGSPASEAGLQGGDIIVTVAGEEVSSLADLRFGLSAFQGPIQIRVIRKGEPVQIMIRR
jgi:C-terminal processing protease CtpA/Prc